MTDDELDELISPVCQLAEMQTNAEARRGKSDRYPADLEVLILAARKVKAGYCFHVETVPFKHLAR